ncbi:MAG: hypothetical protein JNK12_24795 [Acidimicrobiales bacterium]|nr:hypothetical protein [Acidimicrobiales bacterium]
MSDYPQDPTWWQASDSRWYPPQPIATPTPIAPGTQWPAQPVAPTGKVTTLDPVSASQHVAWLLASAGAIVTGQSPSAVTGYVVTEQGPSAGIGCLLFLFGLLPGLLYLLLAKSTRHEPFTLTLQPGPAGTHLHGNGQGRGLAVLVWAADQLPGVTQT